MASYLFYKFIKKNKFKVVIGGEGADELFWGYDIFMIIIKILLKEGRNKKMHIIFQKTNLFLKNSKNYKNLIVKN